ncbi:hypothetical protein [Rhodococcus sp. NCIMB 12038]|uniref:hypothetical protein n=1 Tax=Rhodococcus sp. NCIMB 12038 TaxID=933800 RepID=UPI00117BBE46|nr:hypothetical protein [Rhodococcus sp. NCIMB 12038]
MARVWPLVRCEEVLRLINTAVTGAGGDGGVVIAGPPGVGKSRLADDAIANIRPGRWVPRWARATASARALPQIAEKLTVSVRAVEGHLYRASRKTGLTGRDDLGGTLTGD